MSLYVHPAARGAGVARRALDAVYEAAVTAGLNGVQLHTHWAGQSTVRWYLACSMWVMSWKHDLGLSRVKYLSRYEVTHSGPGFALAVEDGALVRGSDEWESAPACCDTGQPEGLARKIGVFEGTARADGWLVRTPPLALPADLPTPSWART